MVVGGTELCSGFHVVARGGALAAGIGVVAGSTEEEVLV